MSGKGGKALTVMAAVAISWYTGVKFWQPLVMYVLNGYLPHTLLTLSEQLKEDGNLRTDIYVNDKDDLPKSWQDIKDKWKDAVHPEGKLSPNASDVVVDRGIVQNGSDSAHASKEK